jgi:hypothetical protein
VRAEASVRHLSGFMYAHGTVTHVCGGDDLRSSQRLTSGGPRTSTATVTADAMTSTHALSTLKERAAPWSFAYSWIDLHFRLDCRRPYTQRIFTANTRSHCTPWPQLKLSLIASCRTLYRVAILLIHEVWGRQEARQFYIEADNSTLKGYV